MSKTIAIKQFNGGMTADPQDTSIYSQLCKHFDNFTKSHSLIPYKDSESVYASQDTAQLQSFLMYNSIMYALGVVIGSGKASIYSLTGIDNPTIGTPANAFDSSGSTDFRFFTEYHGLLYGIVLTRGIWSYDIAGTTFNSNDFSVTGTNVSNGLVFSKSDVLYVGIDNKIYVNDSGSWSLALTIPSNLIISSICEFGNYLAIGCRSKYPNSVNSRVFLWDRDSTLTTLSESIDYGANDLYVLDNIDGYLIGISVHTAVSSSFDSKLVFTQYTSGSSPIVFQEEPMFFPTVMGKQKYNNRIYFGVSSTAIGGTTNDYTGIWSVGRNSPTAPFSVNLDRVPNNGVSTSQIKGFILVQDFAYISYLDTTNSDAFGLSKTNDQSSYTTTSIYRTVINPGMPDNDKIFKKKLISITATYRPLPTNGTVVVRYKVDNQSYILVSTNTTNGDQYNQAQDADGTPFSDGRDFEFQLESTGGAEITGLQYTYELIPT